MRDAGIAAARRLGLFAALAEPQPLADLAATLDLDPKSLGWLLAGLVSEGLLIRAAETYHVAQDVDIPLAAAPGGALLAEVLTRKRPLEWSDVAGNLDAVALTIPIDHHLASVTTALVGALAPGLRCGGLVADVGCGSGVHVEAILDAAPAASALLVDRSQVLTVAAGRLARFHGRVELRAADVRRVALPPSQAAMLVQVLHVLRAEAAQAIVARVARALVPGGTLAIVEVAYDDDAAALNPEVAWFGLSLAVHGLPGLVPRSQLEQWCRDAGLVEVRVRHLAVTPDAILVTARAPDSTLFPE